MCERNAYLKTWSFKNDLYCLFVCFKGSEKKLFVANSDQQDNILCHEKKLLAIRAP